MFPAALAVLGIAATVAHAAIIHINLANQTMHVESREGDFTWPISSARSGFVTPRGTYGVQRLEAMHYSRKYHNSPMPHSIFFSGGYAIHGTYATGSLGAPASHGCVRLAPGNAATLYQIVRSEGARIAISGAPAASPHYARAERREYRQTIAYRPSYARPPLAYAPAYDAEGNPVRSLNQWLQAPAPQPMRPPMDGDDDQPAY